MLRILTEIYQVIKPFLMIEGITLLVSDGNTIFWTLTSVIGN